MTTVQPHKKWKFFGWGAKLGKNGVKILNLFGLLGLLGLLSRWSIRHWNQKISSQPVNRILVGLAEPLRRKMEFSRFTIGGNLTQRLKRPQRPKRHKTPKIPKKLFLCGSKWFKNLGMITQSTIFHENRQYWWGWVIGTNMWHRWSGAKKEIHGKIHFLKID